MSAEDDDLKLGSLPPIEKLDTELDPEIRFGNRTIDLLSVILIGAVAVGMYYGYQFFKEYQDLVVKHQRTEDLLYGERRRLLSDALTSPQPRSGVAYYLYLQTRNVCAISNGPYCITAPDGQRKYQRTGRGCYAIFKQILVDSLMPQNAGRIMERDEMEEMYRSINNATNTLCEVYPCSELDRKFVRNNQDDITLTF